MYPALAASHVGPRPDLRDGVAARREIDISYGA